MRTIEILDIKEFMQLLLQSDTFDLYDLVSGEIHTDMLYTIDGHMNHSFFSEEEQDIFAMSEHTYLPWKLAKAKVFLLIKGRKIPSSMKLVLRLPEHMITQIIRQQSTFQPDDISGIYLNILFQGQKLNVTCGISYKIFTLNKDLEDDISSVFITLFKSKHITCQ